MGTKVPFVFLFRQNFIITLTGGQQACGDNYILQVSLYFQYCKIYRYVSYLLFWKNIYKSIEHLL